jgi:hypothetical protein
LRKIVDVCDAGHMGLDCGFVSAFKKK